MFLYSAFRFFSIVDMVTFLVSEKADYVTGVTESMDGGQYPFVV